MAKILLVEDDNNLREIYGARLMAEGFQIVAAADGEEALAVAVKEKPDLIISDVMMPKISGFDMLDILRTTPETKNTKVIMMTALSQPEDRERGEKLGADKYLVKSQVTLEDVVAVVHEILGDSEGSVTNDPEPVIQNPDSKDAKPDENTAPAPEPSPVPEPAPAPVTPVEEPTPAPVPAPEPSPVPEPTPTPEPTPAPETPIEEPAPTPETEVKAEEPPEPASKKKKIIEPLNDMNEPDIQKLAQEEEAREKESTPGAEIGPLPGTEPDISETMAEEKAEMEDQIKDFINSNDSGVDETPVPDASTSSESTSPAESAPAPVVEPSPEDSSETPEPSTSGGTNPNDIAL